MANIQSDNSELGDLLYNLTEVLKSEGAWFNPDLVINADNGEITIKSISGQQDKRSFVRIPLKSIPLVKDFDINVENDVFTYSTLQSNLPPNHIEIMDLMLSVFNICSKIKQWKTSNPLLALGEYPQVREKLCQAKIKAPKLIKYLEMIEQGKKNELILESFLGSRIFNLNAKFLQEIGYEDADQDQSVILPVIDYFNHRLQAEGFSTKSTPPPPSMRVFGIPDKHTHEVFVRYNQYDPVDTFLFYGFVDSQPPWLASIPLDMDIPDGRKLRIINTGGVIKKQIPKEIKDLRLYMPMIIKESSDIIKLNKILIPARGAPRALQRVLFNVLKSLMPDMNRPELINAVKSLEKEIIEANTQWWDDMSDMADSLPPNLPIAQSLKDLCAWSKNHIHTYQQIRQSIG